MTDELNNHAYYIRRAEESHRLAQQATNPVIADIHAEMAYQYETLAARIAPQEASPPDQPGHAA